MSETMLKAKLRENTGKSATRKYRADGWVPAEYYSVHDNNIHLLLNQKEFESTIVHGHGLITLQVEGQKKDYQCVIKDTQFDPVKGNLLHADFQGVTLGEKLTLKVPIVLKGTSVGVKAGGIMEFIVREVEVECLPRHIPENLEIDVTNLNIGDSIRVKEIDYENIKILDDPEETIVLVEHSRVALEMEEAEAAEALGEEEEAQEPEVIGRGKEGEEKEE